MKEPLHFILILLFLLITIFHDCFTFLNQQITQSINLTAISQNYKKIGKSTQKWRTCKGPNYSTKILVHFLKKEKEKMKLRSEKKGKKPE